MTNQSLIELVEEYGEQCHEHGRLGVTYAGEDAYDKADALLAEIRIRDAATALKLRALEDENERLRAQLVSAEKRIEAGVVSQSLTTEAAGVRAGHVIITKRLAQLAANNLDPEDGRGAAEAFNALCGALNNESYRALLLSASPSAPEAVPVGEAVYQVLHEVGNSGVEGWFDCSQSDYEHEKEWSQSVRILYATPPASDAAGEMERNAARYKHVRRLNVSQFAALFRANLDGDGSFDELVDAALAVRDAE